MDVGQGGDAPMLIRLLGQLSVPRVGPGRPRTRPASLAGDKAYSSKANRAHLRGRRITAVIPEPTDQIGHRRRRGSAGGRPVDFDPVAYRRRNVIERAFNQLKQWFAAGSWRCSPAHAISRVGRCRLTTRLRRYVVTEATELPTVLGPAQLSNSFLGRLVEVCFATRDLHRTMEGLVRLGIGPWRIYTFDAATMQEQRYRGAPADYGLLVAFSAVGEVAFEIMQPLHGPSVIRDFLDAHGEGVHHLAFDCAGVSWQQRLDTFADRAFPCLQSGRFAGGNSFAFFDTEAATGTTFETYAFPEHFTWPEPQEWYPGPPPATTTS